MGNNEVTLISNNTPISYYDPIRLSLFNLYPYLIFEETEI